jgi:glycine cleavage system pyridoxal-binding protein P
LVYWESLLRYIAALVLVPAALLGDVGLIAAPLGLGDVAIGLVDMFGLPKELGSSHQALFFDHLEEP